MSKLTAEQRDKLSSGQFALPAKRAYPLPDIAHARNALARVSQHGTPTERKAVRDAVSRRYPGIKEGLSE